MPFVENDKHIGTYVKSELPVDGEHEITDFSSIFFTFFMDTIECLSV